MLSFLDEANCDVVINFIFSILKNFCSILRRLKQPFSEKWVVLLEVKGIYLLLFAFNLFADLFQAFKVLVLLLFVKRLRVMVLHMESWPWLLLDRLCVLVLAGSQVENHRVLVCREASNLALGQHLRLLGSIDVRLTRIARMLHSCHICKLLWVDKALSDRL